MINPKFKKYGFHRYKKRRHLTKTDIVENVHDNNTIQEDYHGCYIFIQWHRIYDNDFYNHSYIEAYILKNNKYVAEYHAIYEDKIRLMKKCKKYIDLLIKEDIITESGINQYVLNNNDLKQ